MLTVYFLVCTASHTRYGDRAVTVMGNEKTVHAMVESSEESALASQSVIVMNEMCKKTAYWGGRPVCQSVIVMNDKHKQTTSQDGRPTSQSVIVMNEMCGKTAGQDDRPASQTALNDKHKQTTSQDGRPASQIALNDKHKQTTSRDGRLASQTALNDKHKQTTSQDGRLASQCCPAQKDVPHPTAKRKSNAISGQKDAPGDNLYHHLYLIKKRKRESKHAYDPDYHMDAHLHNHGIASVCGSVQHRTCVRSRNWPKRAYFLTLTNFWHVFYGYYDGKVKKAQFHVQYTSDLSFMKSDISETACAVRMSECMVDFVHDVHVLIENVGIGVLLQKQDRDNYQYVGNAGSVRVADNAGVDHQYHQYVDHPDSAGMAGNASSAQSSMDHQCVDSAGMAGNASSAQSSMDHQYCQYCQYTNGAQTVRPDWLSTLLSNPGHHLTGTSHEQLLPFFLSLNNRITNSIDTDDLHSARSLHSLIVNAHAFFRIQAIHLSCFKSVRYVDITAIFTHQLHILFRSDLCLKLLVFPELMSVQRHHMVMRHTRNSRHRTYTGYYAMAKFEMFVGHLRSLLCMRVLSLARLYAHDVLLIRTYLAELYLTYIYGHCLGMHFLCVVRYAYLNRLLLLCVHKQVVSSTSMHVCGMAKFLLFTLVDSHVLLDIDRQFRTEVMCRRNDDALHHNYLASTTLLTVMDKDRACWQRVVECFVDSLWVAGIAGIDHRKMGRTIMDSAMAVHAFDVKNCEIVLGWVDMVRSALLYRLSCELLC